jgi:hypothetical protein
MPGGRVPQQSSSFQQGFSIVSPQVLADNGNQRSPVSIPQQPLYAQAQQPQFAQSQRGPAPANAYQQQQWQQPQQQWQQPQQQWQQPQQQQWQQPQQQPQQKQQWQQQQPQNPQQAQRQLQQVQQLKPTVSSVPLRGLMGSREFCSDAIIGLEGPGVKSSFSEKYKEMALVELTGIEEEVKEETKMSTQRERKMPAGLDFSKEEQLVNNH